MNDAGYLYDYVDGNFKDPDVRPNMLLAISLTYSPLKEYQKIGNRFCHQKELLLLGIRSLTPKSSRFRPHYRGK